MATGASTAAAKLALQSWIEGLISAEAELSGSAASSFSIDNIVSMAEIDKVLGLMGYRVQLDDPWAALGLPRVEKEHSVASIAMRAQSASLLLSVFIPGADEARAYMPPEIAATLSSYDDTSDHYEVLIDDGHV